MLIGMINDQLDEIKRQPDNRQGNKGRFASKKRRRPTLTIVKVGENCLKIFGMFAKKPLTENKKKI